MTNGYFKSGIFWHGITDSPCQLLQAGNWDYFQKILFWSRLQKKKKQFVE